MVVHTLEQPNDIRQKGLEWGVGGTDTQDIRLILIPIPNVISNKIDHFEH